MWSYIGMFAFGIAVAEAVRLTFKACLGSAVEKREQDLEEMKGKYKQLQDDYSRLEESACKSFPMGGVAAVQPRRLDDMEELFARFCGSSRTINGRKRW